MDTDPLTWSVAQVADFFWHQATRFLSDRPTLRLPELDAFLQSLEENDVNGDILLNAVDTATLREDLGVRSLGARTAVIHCIRKLKALSDARQNGAPEPAPQTPNSIVGLTNQISDPEPVPVPSPGENIRPGETQVQDGRGKKRRKLDLSAMQTVQEVPQAKTKTLASADGYMSAPKLPVDELFYGKTAFNAQLADLKPKGDNVDLEPNYPFIKDHEPYSEDEERWHREMFVTFQEPNTTDGDATYVYRQMRYFMANDDSKLIKRRGRDAIAILPYREALITGKKSVSATVFRLDDNAEDGAIAVRENAAFLEEENDFVGVDIAGQEQESNAGEWDFLTTKWARKDGNKMLPEFGQSEGDNDEMSSRMERELEDEEREVQAELNGNIEREAAIAIIDDEIRLLAEHWNEVKLSRKEEKHAWTIWKQMKRSKTIRAQLIESANERIRELNTRLTKQKDRILETEWRKEKDIREQCDAMSTTVEEREELHWKISVWNRKQEPYHVVRHGQHTGSTSRPNAANNQRIVVHPNDRLSVSPAPVQEDAMQEDSEHFHTPEGGETNQNEQEEPMLIDDGHSFDGGDELEEADSPIAGWIEPSPPAIFGSPPHLPSDAVKDEQEANTGSRKVEPHDNNTSESGFLPDMTTFLSQHPKPTPEPKSTPKKGMSSNSRDQPIEISSDSHSTPASKGGRKKRMAAAKKARNFSSDPLGATADDVKSWDINDLIEQADRHRLLIKMLFDAGPKKREEVQKYFLSSRIAGFSAALKEALGLLRQDFSAVATKDGSQTSIFCAKLYLAWSFLSPETLQGQRPKGFSPTRPLDFSQTEIFSGLLRSTLQTKKLFIIPKPEPTPTSSAKSNRTPGAVISLLESEDDDSDPVRDTPSKRKQKKPLLSMKGEQSQRQAFNRQSRFKELQMQSSSQNQLEAMVSTNPSRSHIQVNILKGDDEDDIFVDKRIAADMKNHQAAGVQFMWRELTAAGEDSAQGCILAHEQGLGKTVQAIAVLVALNEAAQSKNPRIFEQLPPRLRPADMKDRQLRTLILVPAALVANWRAELKKWAPERLPNVYSAESHHVKDHGRLLEQWFRTGGVMIMGYDSFKKKVVRKEGKSVKLAAEGLILRCLVDPGPDIMIADEAHQLGNEKSIRSIAVSQIQTETRMALTGTPMSNDVQEIYSLVSLVAPDYLGDSAWFSAQYARPIKEGNGKDSTAYQRRKAVKKLAVLHKNIEPKVDRAKITVLEGQLPPKVEFVIKLPLTGVQHAAYTKYVQHLVGEGKTKDAAQVTLFGYLSVLTLLLNHPLAFKRKMFMPGKARIQTRAPTPSESDSGAVTPARDVEPDAQAQAEAQAGENDDAGDSIRTSGFTEESIQRITSHIGDEIDPLLSTKTSVLMEIVHRSKACDDKVLIFSQSIPSLDYLGELLKSFGIKFVRIDGSMNPKLRNEHLEEMQSGKRDLMLMSTKAGGVGLNIQVANRVIILDSSFNPTHEAQAISRSYRLGQKKPVFVYRFTVGGTFEDMLYNKQMFKERLNKGVVDKITTKRIANVDSKHAIREPTEVGQEDLEESLGKDKVLDGIVKDLRDNAKRYGEEQIIIRSLATMEVLQEKVVDEPLNEEEQREVEMELLEGRNAGKGKKPAVAPSNVPASTAPAKSKRSQPGSAGVRWAQLSGSQWHPPMAPPPAPAPAASQAQAPSRIVTLPTGGLPPRSTAPTVPHGLPIPPKD